jgi:16S rRNA (guanine527-N7)-methyltransferase
VPVVDTEPEIVALLAEAGVAGDLAERLAAYGALLLDANRRVNLTGAADAAALVPHLLDSLTLVPLIAPGRTLVDIGSGGGFPGIPLAIATGVRVTLIEPIAKKAAFLRTALEACGLEGEALAERAEVAAREPRYREAFDLATARAVSRAPTVAELAMPFLRIGGRALLQRGALDERERQAVEDAAPVLGGVVLEERALAGERRVLILEKRVASSERFPRRNGVPEKRPLCWQ